MDTQRSIEGLSPREYAALTQGAKARAIELRREAINEFWDALARRVRSAWRALVIHPPAVHGRAPTEAQPCLR